MHYILTPERIDYIAERVAAAYAAEFSPDRLTELESRIAELDREFDRLADSLIKTTSQRMIDNINVRASEIEHTIAELQEKLSGLRAGAKAAIRAPEVKKFLKGFCSGNATDPTFQQNIIDALVHAVYLYDDKMLIYYNIPGARQLSEISELLDADTLVEGFCSDCCMYGHP